MMQYSQERGKHDQLKHRLSRTRKPKSSPSSNTQCPITHNPNTTTGTARTRPGIQKTDTRYRMSACGGARGIRTPDLLIANETRYQLRHSPKDGYTLAPSEVSTQADREQQVIAPRTPQRRRDIEDDPDQDDPFPSATKGPLPSVTKGATKEPRREPGGSRRGNDSNKQPYWARRASRTASRSRATA